MTAVADYHDRSLVIGQDQIVKTAWIDINRCIMGNRTPMATEAVDKAVRRLINQGNCGSWPPINGHWSPDGQRFIINDGRHEYIASLIRGMEKVFVAWVDEEGG